MTVLTGILRAMVVVGSALIILAGSGIGYGVGQGYLGEYGMDGSSSPVLGFIIGATAGLVVASITFGVVALLFQISDTLEDIRGELRRQVVAMGPAGEPRLDG